jgi:hypothetical protein
VAADGAAVDHDLGGRGPALVAEVSACRRGSAGSLILAYTAYVYWLFRGKVTADSGYH